MSLWTLGFLAGLVVVLIVALTLIGILVQARRIARLAPVAAQLVSEIEANTRSVWALRDTNQVAAEILGAAEAIDANTAAIADAVSHTHGSQETA